MRAMQEQRPFTIQGVQVQPISIVALLLLQILRSWPHYEDKYRDFF